MFYIYDKRGKDISVGKIIVGAGIIPVLYGGFIEYVQGKYYPPRSADWYDLVADILGVIAGLLLAFWFNRLILKRKVFAK